MEYALQIKNLSRAYGELPILQNISLSIKKGEFVSVVGPSGCGKSTLLKVLAGLLQAQSDQLEVVENRSVVFQDPTLLEWRTILQNIELPTMLAAKEDGKKHNQSIDLIELVDLTGFEDYYPSQLSGGMKQRVAIARALKSRPQLLLMDEPFGALDELTREKMNVVLLRARAKEATDSPAAVLFVTHSIPEAVFLSDRVVVMSPRPGRIEKIIEIPIPRPRKSQYLRHDPEFVRLTKEIRDALKI